MTVKELIDYLEILPQNLIVFLKVDDGGSVYLSNPKKPEVDVKHNVVIIKPRD